MSSLLGLLLTSATGARAQTSYEHGRLYCGENVFDLRGVSDLTISPSEVRIRDLTALQQFVRKALAVCKRPGPSLFGCNSLSKAINQRSDVLARAWPSATVEAFAARAELLSNDRALELEARRVLEHNQCRQEPNLDQPSPSCARLIEQEATLRNSEAVTLKAFDEDRKPLAPEQPLDSGPETQSLRMLIERADGDGVQPSGSPVKSAGAPDTFDKEIEIHRKNGDECRKADWYVDAHGQLRPDSADPPKSICVDIANHSLSGPLQVRVAHEGTRRSFDVWPGVVSTELSSLKATGIASLTVQGAPSGYVLGIIAARELNTDNDTKFVLRLKLDGLKNAADGASESREAALALKEEIGLLREALKADGIENLEIALNDVFKAVADHERPTDRELGTIERAIVEIAQRASLSSSTWQNARTKAKPARRKQTEEVAIRFRAQFPERPVRQENRPDYLKRLGDFRSQVARSLDLLDKLVLDRLGAATSPKPDYELLLSRLCFAAQHRVLLVAQDELLAKEPQLIDFDFNQGLISRPNGAFRRTDPIYVKVRHVPAGAGLTVILDGKKISTASQPLLGRPESDPPPKVSDSANRVSPGAIFSVAQQPQLSTGTLVLTIPPPPGGRRYDLQLCTSASVRDQRADCSNATLLGSFEIAVSGEFHLGVRSGVGVGWTDVSTAAVSYESGAGDGQVWVVGREKLEAQVSVPLLFTWYPSGRSPLDRKPVLGLTSGVEITAPSRRLYPVGLVFDVGGIGVGGSLVVERVERVFAPAGRRITSASRPNLATLFDSDEQFRPGAAFWLTADLDLFRVLFGELFGSQYPVLRSAESKP